MPTIYYIRHGETDWNATGRFQGSQDIPLNARGESQATHAGAVLAGLVEQAGRTAGDLPYVSSPLGRARVTMERLRDVLGLPRDGYALDDRLREVGYGLWEGSTLAQMEASHPAVFAQRQIDKWGVAPPGGESYVALTQRVREWHASLTTDIVAVAHGGTMRALMVVTGVATPAEAADTAIGQGVVYVFDAKGLTRHA